MRRAASSAAALGLALALAVAGCLVPREPPAECPAPLCGDGLLASGETCDDGNTIDVDDCSADCARAWTTDRWLPATARADILFVIDDGVSMCEEQVGLFLGIAGFIDGLTASGALDFHVGVITTTSFAFEEDVACFTGVRLALAVPPPATATVSATYPAGAPAGLACRD